MKIQAGMLITNMAGSLNGQTVRRSKSGLVLQRKATGRSANTTTAGLNRQYIRQVANYWRSLNPTDKLDWKHIADTHPINDRFGNPIVLSAYAYYTRVQMLLLKSRQTVINASNYDERVNAITNVTVTLASGAIYLVDIELDSNNYAQNFVFFAQRKAKGSSAVFLKWQQERQVLPVSSPNEQGYIDFSFVNPFVPEEWSVGVYLVTRSGGVSAVVFADVT